LISEGKEGGARFQNLQGIRWKRFRKS
jgi:hypothetical protein